MTKARIGYAIYWVVYFAAMGHLYQYMEEKIPKYIKEEVVKRGN